MRVERFGDFELDRSAGELRLGGRALALQPRVFSLLAFLADNPGRVVDKDELLAAIWPGVIVTDASLQRAVSIARSALREGGCDGAIRTYARRGYRFCVELTGAKGEAAGDCGEALAAARTAFANSDWVAASEAFASADGPLAASELECWATATLCAGRLRAATAPLERAATAYSGAGRNEDAARTNLMLARIRLELREIDVARGCLRRAASLLEDLPLGVQHGHLAWLSARFGVYDGDLSLAVEHARRALALGKQFASVDLETIGKLYLGVALQASGDTSQGLALQAEAAAAVVAGDVSPLIGGIVYCGLLAGYCNAGELQRAGQWTDSFTRWCERSKMALFQGSCLLHRAEVFASRGELERAHSELVAGDEVLRVSAPWAIGDAQRLLGDLHLARGEFERAEAAYAAAREHGWDPNPGYAMLLHYRGESPAALRSLRRAADAQHWVAGEKRGNYLAHIVTIAALSGELECAAATLAEIDAHAEVAEVGAVKAQVCRARAELLLAQGDCEAALRWFRRAVSDLVAADACLDAAVIRLRLAACLARAGDSEEAAIERAAARKRLEKAGARFYLELSRSTPE